MHKHVVYFSGGAASWAAAKRVIQRWGRESVTLLFADTLSEDCDLYRFLKDAEKNLGKEITRVSEGRTVWQVFHDEGFIGNSRVDLCSRILKRQILDNWRNQNCWPGDSTHYIGYDWAEGGRAEKLRKYIYPWKYEFPMFERPLLTKFGMLKLMESEGLRAPRLYDMGFSNNNCGGACVKAGHASWRLLHRVMPDRYAYHEAEEQSFIAKHGEFSILKDRRGGTTKPLTLKQFRERIEAESTPSLLDDEEWGGCGCATDYEPDEPVAAVG